MNELYSKTGDRVNINIYIYQSYKNLVIILFMISAEKGPYKSVVVVFEAIEKSKMDQEDTQALINEQPTIPDVIQNKLMNLIGYYGTERWNFNLRLL